ncbi:LysR family transcriptional regulator [Burkholderia ubonensis]|uniref:LysR family transcriptional regulator n=1 Tax=Burkholderia ubonensis TaxID=101571 RepID=UPI000BA76F40|nr:LysR family transcriptional regulator [Burkholderia ubonensis]PAJ88327.1 hypothetical protein CJO70_07595 [Burkholderia ubonensis]PAJ94796.1 hypothetical protein CJO69_09550 [Burkholderia ubonensis]PAK08712.1 hypothetical protein CJO67_06900 [Burkholderia ubonensis]RQP71154.1 LysR family transcriptional regulator [Burkholderia ubonensis]RQP82802.1 LysR family transcriptional regulator [Burkholderia ubonensis]
MARLNLNAVRVFATVAVKGSFTAAGRELQIPTSNVSRHVAQLEASLQTRLIERHARRLTLTDAGRLLFERCRPMFDALDDTLDELASGQTRLQGRLRVSLPSEVGPQLFGAAVADFACRHPAVDLRCSTSLAGLETGLEDLDLAIIIGRGGLPDSSCIVKPMLSWPSVVVAAPSVIDAHGRPERIESLESLPCITTVGALDGRPWRFLGAAALRGVGFAIVVEAACRGLIERGELVPIALDKPAAPLELYAAYPQRRHLPATVRAFIDHLTEAAGTLHVARSGR